ncbi:MAG: ABC transporter permease subunit [Spirochaetaceae bacterium]|jgi:putative aldouronate transport system permease protein|nr:ABC transporter permease subunit [Spirochaetaceae bacterium]
MKNGLRKPWTSADTQISLLALPTAVWFLLFSYLPMFGVIIAFKKYHINGSFLNSLLTSDWVGLHYFKLLLNNDDVWIALRNTIAYNLVMLVVGTTLTIALALLVSELLNKQLAKVYQTLMFFPYFLSWVVITALVWGFLSQDMGLVNDLIVRLGGERRRFYMESGFWPPFLVFLSQWKTLGYSMIVYLATITGLDKEIYEAALIDGASKWKQVTRITLPMMRTVIVLMFILNIGKIFYSDFGLFYQVPRDSNSLAAVTTTLDVFVYKQLMSPTTPIGMTAAAALFQSVTALVLTLLANKIVSRIDPDSAMI